MAKKVKSQEDDVKARPSGWLTAAMAMLLVGGLAHMLPDQMGPLLGLAVYGVSLQVVVGVVSVFAALYYLMNDEERHE